MSSAKKFDQDKAPLGTIPTVALEQEALAFKHGAKKYGQWNFKKGMDWTRLIDASLRHIAAFKDGEDMDPESGYHHLGHARACLSMLLDYFYNELGTDDRFKSVVERGEFDEKS